VSLTGKTKVGNLHGIGRRRGWGSHEGRVAAERRVGGGRGRHENVLWFDIAVEEVVGMNMF
jgi:hypothetical protein